MISHLELRQTSTPLLLFGGGGGAMTLKLAAFALCLVPLPRLDFVEKPEDCANFTDDRPLSSLFLWNGFLSIYLLVWMKKVDDHSKSHHQKEGYQQFRALQLIGHGNSIEGQGLGGRVQTQSAAKIRRSEGPGQKKERNKSRLNHREAGLRSQKPREEVFWDSWEGSISQAAAGVGSHGFRDPFSVWKASEPSEGRRNG